jgi:hypothetical protein
VSAHLLHCFWIDVSQVCSPTDVDSDLLVPSRVYSLLLGFLNHVLVTISPFLSQKLISIWPLWFFLPRPCGPTMFLYVSFPTTIFQSPIMMLFVLPFPSS